MNCPLCGEVCRCQSEPLSPALPQGSPIAESGPGSSLVGLQDAHPETTRDAQFSDRSEERIAATGEGGAADTKSSGPASAPPAAADREFGNVGPDSPAEVTPQDGDAPAWRDELSARFDRYRARRKVRPPRYPSLNLPFEALELPMSPNASGGSAPRPGFESVSNHALALNGMRHDPDTAKVEVQAPLAAGLDTAPQPLHHSTGHSSAKIIEFPRFAWGPPAPPPDQLAEPVSERPRILDVPEVAPPPPALGGITIEVPDRQEAEKRPGIDIPLQSAPLGMRFVAALIDGIIIAAASALFSFIFWKVAAVRPPQIQILGLAAGMPGLFWAAYQYLLIVYAASTPGLRVAGLELARFDGTMPTRALRRWRVLAAYLSAVSLGMGYAWVFLDEDALCWHDRITHTYLAPKRRRATEPTPSN